MVSVSVSKIFGIEEVSVSEIFVFEKELSESVSKKFGIEKIIGISFVKKMVSKKVSWLVFLLILLQEMKPYSWFLTYILHKLSWQGIVTSSGALKNITILSIKSKCEAGEIKKSTMELPGVNKSKHPS